MPKYVYSGPLSGVTIGDREVMLSPGATVDLPDNSYTTTLLARRHLRPVDVGGAVQESAPTPDLKAKNKKVDVTDGS